MKTGKVRSGVEFGINNILGEHQEILSKAWAKEDIQGGLHGMLAGILEYFGDNKNVTEKDVNGFLDCDIREMLLVARQESMDNEPFEFTWKDPETQTEYPFTYDFQKDGEFPLTTVKKLENGKLVDANFESYKEEDLYVELEKLPKSGKKVKFRMLTGKGNTIGASVEQKDRSTSTPLKMRNIQEWDGKKWSVYNLRKAEMKDLAFIRKSIFNYEGRIGTEIQFAHPTKKNEVFTIDALGQLAFFFPSEKL